MLFLYRTFINILLLFSPLIIIYRIFKKKEDPKRFFEKLGVSSMGFNKNSLIWFHVSSVGELLSIVPMIEKIEEKKKNFKILVTSNTLSSAKIFEKYKFKKTFHQFFPIDSNIIIKKFLNNWKPNIAIFVESEIWPNMILEVKRRKIPLVLLNARITKKTFNKWIRLGIFCRFIFEKFDICLSQNNDTKNFLKKLGAKKIFYSGNLKFSETSIDKNLNLKKSINDFFKNKKFVFGGISTHETEEEFCIKLFEQLKRIYKNLILVIIPRHVNRTERIIQNLSKYKLNIHKHSDKKILNRRTEVYIVDTFGDTKKFLKKCSIVFLGGSLIPHGGQNPIEAARYGLKIIHGPNIENFTEVYNLLKNIGLSHQIKSQKDAFNIINKVLKHKLKKNLNVNRLNLMGNKILIKNYNYISKYF